MAGALKDHGGRLDSHAGLARGRVDPSRRAIDPVARALTHLVVEPKHGQKKGHLVPVNLAVPTTDGVALACTTAEFEELDEAAETQFISGGSGQFRYGQDQMMSWPTTGWVQGGRWCPVPK